MTNRTLYRVSALLVPLTALAVGLLSWSAPEESDSLGPLCQDVMGEMDSSSAPVAFAARLASPYTYKFDTGFEPSLPFRIKFFYYSSPGELDLKAAGHLIASWEAAQAFPGNRLLVSIGALGDSLESRWESDGGLRFGARYKYNVKFGWKRFKKEDYVPKIPHFDMSWPCTTTFYPFALSSPPAPYEACANYWGRGQVPCFLKIRTVSETYWPQSCDFPGGWDPEVDLDWCFDPDTSGLDTLSFWAYIRAHPSVKFGLGANLGACAVLSLEGDSIVDSQSGGSITNDEGSIQVDVKIPCDFAKATEGQRVFHFTQGPFSYHADLLFQLVGKLEPVIKPCFAELLEVALSVGAAICGLIVPNAAISISLSLPFSDMDATFSVPISDPVVCNIHPPPPDSVVAFDTTEIAWNTSWGAPDSCQCKVKLWYHTRLGSPSPWSEWIPIDTVRLNTGKYDWLVPPLIGQEAQILVEFLDPDQNLLHKDSSDIFVIVPPTFTMTCNPPLGYATPGDQGVDVYWIDIGSAGGYVENVQLQLLSVDPAASITVTFTPNGVPPPYTTDVAVTVDEGVSYGDYTLTFLGMGDDAQEKICDVILRVQSALVCGDCDTNELIDLGDVVYLLNYLFRGGTPPQPLCIADANCDGVADLADAIYLLNYLFKAGPLPCEECCSLGTGSSPSQRIQSAS